jgi:hypothetical protein
MSEVVDIGSGDGADAVEFECVVNNPAHGVDLVVHLDSEP